MKWNHSVWEVLIIATNPPYNFRGVSLFPLGSLSKALHGSWLGVCVHASVSMWCLLVFASFAGMASLFDIRAQNLQSPPKESIHFCRAEYSKLRGARWKVGGAPNPPLSWSKLGQASFCNSKNPPLSWSKLGQASFLKRGCLRLFVLVSPSFRISKRGLVQFRPTQGWVWRTPTFPLAPLDFEYLALPQVYTFFQWRL